MKTFLSFEVRDGLVTKIAHFAIGIYTIFGIVLVVILK
jgi:hypothetical protein